jgi:putative redox protein
MTATIQYEGNLRCNARHLQSNSLIETDAPTDNRGKGERFSPTDLVCTALATCMITTMAMKATDMGIELKNTIVNVQKHMASDPRRIAKIDVELTFPDTVKLEE